MYIPQLCQLCKMQAIRPISLICSHTLCLKCAQNIAIQENTSQIQNKFRIQCSKCRKTTHTYDITNLLIENNQLNLITDSSEMDKEILNESQLQQDNRKQTIFEQQKSKPIIQKTIAIQEERKNKAMQKELLKPNNNTPNASPYSTPLASQFHINFTDNKKVLQPPLDYKKYTQEIKENQFQKEFQKEITEPSRHKRSATGIPNNQSADQLLQQYFALIQKGIAKLEKDTISIAKQKNIAPQALYQKMKQLSQNKDPDGELVQSIRMMQKLQQELIGLSTPSCHRKTSSHASQRYSNNTTNTKSDHSSTSILQQEFKNLKKLF